MRGKFIIGLMLLVIASCEVNALQIQFQEEKIILDSGRDIYNPVSFDIDLDGDGDIIFSLVSSLANTKDQLGWIENLGESNFSEFKFLHDANSIFGAFLAQDIDNDNDQDIIVAQYSPIGTYWYENNGDNSFLEKKQIATKGTLPRSIVSADFDNDLDIDIAIGYQLEENIYMYLNNGDKTFDEGFIIGENIDDPMDMHVNDFNNDGYLDIAVVSRNDNKLRVFYNDNLNFNEILLSDGINYPIAVHSDDINNDGFIDIITGPNNGKDIYIFKNIDGTNFVVDTLSTNIFYGVRDIETGDLDKDGDIDIVTTKAGGSYFENLNNSSFSDLTQIGGVGNTGIILSDLNSDEYLDIISTSETNDPGTGGSVKFFTNITGTKIEEELLAHYPLNGHFNDESGNEFHGVVTGDITPMEDRWGNQNVAMNFSGSGNYVDIDFNGFPFSNELTISFWAKVSDSEVEYARFLAVNKDTGEPDEMALRINYVSSIDEYRFKIGDGSADDSQIQSYSNPEHWELITAVYDNNELKLYINDDLRKSTITQISLDDFISLRIGDAFGSSRNYNGAMDDLRIYNYALSEEEINALFTNWGWEGYENDAEPIAHYSFDGSVENSITQELGEINGNIQYGLGIRDQSIHFEGDGNVNLGELYTIDDQDFSTSMWIKFDDHDSDNQFLRNSLLSDPNPNLFALTYANNNSKKIRLVTIDQNQNPNNLYTINDYEIDTWYYLTFVRSGGTGFIYVNGELENSGKINGGDIGDFKDWVLGQGHQEGFFRGSIDELQVFDIALTSEQVKTLYNESGGDKLVAYYPFNGNANDESGNGFDAVEIEATLTTDRFGISNNAYQFDGVDDFIQLSGSFSNNQSKGSVSIWVQFEDELDDYNIIAKGPNDFRIQYSQSNDDIYFSLNSENGVDRDYTDSNLDWTQWNHIVITWDENSKSVFLNGQLNYNVSNSFSIESNIGDIYLGRNGGLETNDYEFLKGKIDDLIWFNAKLSESDIQILYSENGWQGSSKNYTAQIQNFEILSEHPELKDESISPGEQLLISFDIENTSNEDIFFSGINTDSNLDFETSLDTYAAITGTSFNYKISPGEIFEGIILEIRLLEWTEINEIVIPLVTENLSLGGDYGDTKNIGEIQLSINSHSDTPTIPLPEVQNQLANGNLLPDDMLITEYVPFLRIERNEHWKYLEAAVSLALITKNVVKEHMLSPITEIGSDIVFSLGFELWNNELKKDSNKYGYIQTVAGTFDYSVLVPESNFMYSNEPNEVDRSPKLTLPVKALVKIRDAKEYIEISDSLPSLSLIEPISFIYDTNSVNNYQYLDLTNYETDENNRLIYSDYYNKKVFFTGVIHQILMDDDGNKFLSIAFVDDDPVDTFIFDAVLSSIFERRTYKVLIKLNEIDVIPNIGSVISAYGILKSDIISFLNNPNWGGQDQVNGFIEANDIIILSGSVSSEIDESKELFSTKNSYGAVTFTVTSTETKNKSTVNLLPDFHLYDSYGNHAGPVYDSTGAIAYFENTIPRSIYSNLGDTLKIIRIDSLIDQKFVIEFNARENSNFSFNTVTHSLNGVGSENIDALTFKDKYLNKDDFDQIYFSPKKNLEDTFFYTDSLTASSKIELLEIPSNWFIEKENEVLSIKVFDLPESFNIDDAILESFTINGSMVSNIPTATFVDNESNIEMEISIGELSNFIGTYDPGTYFLEITFDSNIGEIKSGLAFNITPFNTLTSFSTEINRIPDEFNLLQNYPNPFNPITKIDYSLPVDANVRIDIINTLGQHIATLIDDRLNAGKHSINFDASNLSSGVYFYTINAGNYIKTKKMLLIK